MESHVRVSLMHDGPVCVLDQDLKPGRPLQSTDLDSLKPTSRDRSGVPVVLLHGYKYDPSSHQEDNPHISTFVHWKKNIIPGRSTLDFGWWSCPGHWREPLVYIKSIWLANRRGRYNTYRYCWDLAERAAGELVDVIKEVGPVDVLAHSAGTRVALQALSKDPSLPILNVVLLNGAEKVSTAIEVSKRCPHTQFTNLCVETDDVLRYFGGLFSPGHFYAECIGRKGLRGQGPSNWRDLMLDSAETQRWAAARGWPDVQGDNRNGFWDHWWSHKHSGNWGLIRACLAGEV